MKSWSMNTTEVWKPVHEYEGFYEVSNMGRVRSLRNNITLRPVLDSYGYSIVSLTVKGNHKCKKIHRLVAKAFIPNPEEKPCINHIDYNRSNNVVENLEWVTPKENTAHSLCHFPKERATPKTNPTHEKYIILNRNSGAFRVKYKKKYYGSYKTLEEAVSVRNQIIKANEKADLTGS